MNVLTGLHETRGEYFEENPSNRSFRFAAYKKFIWFVFKRLGKENRRVIPSSVIWKIRELFPENDVIYIPFSHGKDYHLHSLLFLHVYIKCSIRYHLTENHDL